MSSLFLSVLVAASALREPPGRHPGPGEITAMLGVPDHNQLILAWADGTVSCVEAASGTELWSTWLPPEASLDGRIAVTGGENPALLSLCVDGEDHLFMVVYDVSAVHRPRKVRLGRLGPGMYRIVATAKDHVCVHDWGNDLLHDCGVDGTVRCSMDVETCLMGAVLVPQSAPLLVSFHSDRSVIAARLCAKREWTRREEFLEPGGRIGSTVVAIAHEERLVLGLRAADGVEMWRYPFSEAEEFVSVLEDGTLALIGKSSLRLVRLRPDSAPVGGTTIEYGECAEVAAVGKGREIACMPRLVCHSDDVLRRASTKVTVFDALSGKKIHAWTPVKPAVPTSQAAGEWPQIYRKTQHPKPGPTAP